MTAASAYPPESAEGRPAEPSMEDILASIRRIIADDQGGTGRGTPANGAQRAEPAQADRPPQRGRTPYDDVLDLARLVPSPDRGQADRGQVDRGQADPGRGVPPGQAVASLQPSLDRPSYPDGPVRGDEAGAGSGLRARMPEPAGRRAADEEHDMLDHSVPALGEDADGELLSPPLGESVMSAFETLAATVVLQNTPMLERVMRDLLRPMLKTWLDDNLPGLVERLVRTEIERVARGTRG